MNDETIAMAGGAAAGVFGVNQMNEGKRGIWMRRLFVFLLLPSMTYFAGWLAGTIRYGRMVADRQRHAVLQVLESDKAFKNIQLEPCTGDTVVLHGSVPTNRDLQKLTDAMIRAVGFEQGKDCAGMLKVEAQKESVP